MRKLLLALALLALPSGAWAQCTGVFPANTLCGNLSATAQPPRAFPSSGTIVGPGSSLFHGLPIWGNTSGTLLADGTGNSIPGNYTFLSNLTFTGVTAISGSSPTIVSGTASFNGPFQISGSTKTFPSGAVTLGGLSTTQTWSGANTYTGATTLSGTTIVSGTAYFHNPAYFGGMPWIDVKAGAQGCAAAVGDNTTDDTSAIQCAINYISNTAGGIVFFPQGTYKTTSALTVGARVTLQGAGATTSVIDSRPLDINMLNFVGDYAGLKGLRIMGGQYTSSTASTVTVGANFIHITFRDCRIQGGLWAMQTAGVDNTYDNCFVIGYGSTGGNIWINGGANWYRRMKFDDAGGAHAYGALIDAGTLVGAQENAFDQTDFSGNFTTASVWISNTNAYSTFTGSTFSHRVISFKHTWTGLIGAKFGSYVSANANTSIVASRGIAAITATGASCAANTNITC